MHDTGGCDSGRATKRTRPEFIAMYYRDTEEIVPGCPRGVAGPVRERVLRSRVDELPHPHFGAWNGNRQSRENNKTHAIPKYGENSTGN